MNVGFTEFLSNRPAMFVVDDAGRMIEGLPAAFPRQIAEIGVFQIEGREQFIESAEL